MKGDDGTGDAAFPPFFLRRVAAAPHGFSRGKTPVFPLALLIFPLIFHLHPPTFIKLAV